MTERVFKVGDRVRIVRSTVPDRLGVVTTVLGFWVGELDPNSPWYGELPSGTLFCVLDLEARDMDWVGYPPDHLELYREDREPVAWSECLWQPAEERV